MPKDNDQNVNVSRTQEGDVVFQRTASQRFGPEDYVQVYNDTIQTLHDKREKLEDTEEKIVNTLDEHRDSMNVLHTVLQDEEVGEPVTDNIHDSVTPAAFRDFQQLKQLKQQSEQLREQVENFEDQLEAMRPHAEDIAEEHGLELDDAEPPQT